MLFYLYRSVICNVSKLKCPQGQGNLRFIHPTLVRMDAKIIDGKKIAKDIQRELKAELDEWMKLGNRRPTLKAILVGENEASEIYVRNKMKAACKVGIASTTERYPSSVTEQQLLEDVEALNADGGVDGILVQLPLPNHISERAICNAIAPNKDVDGFHMVNVGRLCLDMKSIVPCTPFGVQEILKRSGLRIFLDAYGHLGIHRLSYWWRVLTGYSKHLSEMPFYTDFQCGEELTKCIETFGKHAVVCGRSKNVGMPIAVLLHADGMGETSAMDATTTICHRYTPPDLLAMLTKTADIIIAAAGVPNLIRQDMVKPGACVIDVGITRIMNPVTKVSKLVGDVDFEGVQKVAGYITPVPGGVGPVTVAMLMKNTLIAAKWSESSKSGDNKFSV